MNQTAKRWLIAATSLVAFGVILFTIALCACGFDISKLSTAELRNVSYEVSEDFSAITLHGDTENIHFSPSIDGHCTVICSASEGIRHEVAVTNGSLSIKTVDERAWYEHIGIFTQEANITVSLPQGAYDALSVRSDTGNIDIAKAFSFETMNIHTGTGDIESSASASGSTVLHASTGDISITDCTVGALDVSVSTGDITVSGIGCTEGITLRASTGDIILKDISCQTLVAIGNTGDLILTDTTATGVLSAETDTGDILLDACDAGELYLTADTGDITGTLRSEKVFLAESGTGDIDVPKTVSGGRCEIRTDTGDIEISLLPQRKELP